MLNAAFTHTANRDLLISLTVVGVTRCGRVQLRKVYANMERLGDSAYGSEENRVHVLRDEEHKSFCFISYDIKRATCVVQYPPECSS